MSSNPTSDDRQPEVDDGTLSDVFQQPIKAAGDLSEVAEASPGITTEDLARDLEAVASKSEAPGERELLLQILWRLGRIEQQLEKTGPQVPKPERRSPEEMLSQLMERMGRMERSSDDLSERMRRLERDVDRQRGSGNVGSQPVGSRSKQRPPSEASHSEAPIMPAKVEESPAPASGTTGVVRRGTIEDQVARLTRSKRPPKRQTDPPEKSSKPED